jgi:hypothetical protein
MSEETKVPQNTESEETERAGQAKAERLQFNATINNRFSDELKFVSQKLDWGKFVEGPNNIPKKQVKLGFKTWGAAHSATGTTGYVKYQVGQNQDQYFEIHWTIPFIQSSTYEIKKSSDVEVKVEGWNGSYDSETVIIQVSPS